MMRKRKREILLFILFVILVCVSGCSGAAEDKAASIKAAITVLRDSASLQDLSTQEEKSVIQLLLEKAEADNISEQINAQYKFTLNGIFNYTIEVNIPTLSNITLDSIQYTIPAADYSAPDPDQYKLLIASAVTDSLDTYISDTDTLSYNKYSLSCLVIHDKNGYNASFDNTELTQVITEIDDQIQTLIRSAIELSEIDKVSFINETRKQITEEISDILLNTYGSWEYSFYDRLSIQEFIPKGEDQFSLVFSYPDMDRVFIQAAAEFTSSYEKRYSEGIYSLMESGSLEIDYNPILINIVQISSDMTTRNFIGTRDDISEVTFFLSTLLKNELYKSYYQSIVAAADKINNTLLILPVSSPVTGVMSGSNTGESITFFTSEGDGSYYVKFERLTGTDLNEDGKTELTAYIGDGQTLTVYLPIGNYKLKYGTGASWYGEEQMFGPDGEYVVADVVVNVEYGYSYTLTLYSVFNGNMGSNPISQGDF